jgi:hypothetical protein
MTDLIATVGKKITERWLATVLLPGLLYVAVVGWAGLAGHRHDLDLPWLARRLSDLSNQHGADTGTAVVAVVVALGAASLTGTVAALIAEDGVQRLWTMRGPRRRLDRLRKDAEQAWQHRQPAPPQRYLPERATVIGERFRLLGERVHVQYGLSVTAAWPRIWLLTCNDTRTLIGDACRRYSADATLTAWGLLYLPWALRWWPAIMIAAAAIAVGYRRARSSSRVLATLIEATVDQHASDLAKTLGVDLPEGRLTPEEGNRINNILTKRA